MPADPDEPQPTSAPAQRGWRSAGVVAAMLAAALVFAIGLIIAAMALLPQVLVDESAYNGFDGHPIGPDVQAAYNAVRIPIGVTCAALLAGMAAAAGVYMNARTLAVARDTLAQSRVRDEDARAQWQAEHRQSRFTDAAKQLGDRAPAVRLAGVLSMAALADDWDERRQPCVDVLCAYARQPLDETDGVERNIRRTVVEQIFKRLNPSAPASWSDLRINLSGAFVEGVGYVPAPVEVRELLLDDATIEGFFALDHLTVQTLSLDRADIRYRLRCLLVVTEGTYVKADHLTVPNGVEVHVGLWRPDEVVRGGGVGMHNLFVGGGSVTVSLRGNFDRLSVAMTEAHITSGVVRIVMAEGQAETDAVKVHALVADDLFYPTVSESLRSAMTSDSTFQVMTEAQADGMYDPLPRGVRKDSPPTATPKPAATGE